MSALSSQSTTNVEFDPTLFVKTLCENKKIIIADFCEISFMAGWRNIVEELLNSLCNYPIRMFEITDSHSQIDVHFEVLSNTNELRVWRLIEEARRKSRSECALCGENYIPWQKTKLGIFCKTCSKSSNQKSETGTWLDKY